MKQITAVLLTASTLLAASVLFQSCVPDDLPTPADPIPPGSGTQQPDTPVIPSLTMYECVTAEYQIDTALVAGTFATDALVYISARVPADLGERYYTLQQYAVQIEGYDSLLRVRQELTVYVDSVLRREYPEYYQYRVDRGAYPHGDTSTGVGYLPQITFCNEYERNEVAQR